MAPKQGHIEVKALPLTIQTVFIDGKKMLSSFFKQIAQEALLDEDTGELRGQALGWINIHPKVGCPEAEHLHVLWMHGTALRLATVVQPEASLRFQENSECSFVEIKQ